MAVVENLFVYGPWCKGGLQFQLLEPYVENLSEAYILGRCLRTHVGYPVYLSQGTDRIPGQLVTLRGPDLLWRLLEEFHAVHPTHPERGLYQRLTREVVLVNSEERLLATVFAVSESQVNSSWGPVLAGDWRLCLKTTPALPERMTPRQKNYIQRLGRSTGREIIPIDLDLYRELMKLQLIVDKGRRLALSPLGREVLRYLPT
ncbi:MAG: gamma-glutamylcyclotransferase [Bdellovibrionales bacterium]